MDDSENEELMQQMAMQMFLRRWNRTGNGDGGESLMRRVVPLTTSPRLIVSQAMSTRSSSIPIRDVRSWERNPNTFKNEGCTRCLCKNSKCLMLYCACFVSGKYCAEGCGCQDCHNISNNEEMIHGIRQQIESRNPHAFRRKVVKHATESSQSSGQLAPIPPNIH
ncbi:CRC domain-containing protein TSO1-like protein isoform X2 [Cinnamomum micranthum f. kanehirae]|uniref:CRC domain-containing protein TSO1-like protein isoform X2 n=1 Tax=Cinnamomum micranthum f. kanehirae TaxID=337451 RepID=A0A3S3M9S9_9MAGN|nr:CRC domain-containing protein TSO1-like protein isoform X2 [Cinnamomum micranthum f. kanehirae]